MEFGKLSFENPKPLYLQITDIIEQKITNHELSVGQKLPPQDDLRKVFNVSIDTMKEAISRLTKEGYLACRPRYGTFVVSSEPKKALDFKVNNGILAGRQLKDFLKVNQSGLEAGKNNSSEQIDYAKFNKRTGG